LKDYRIGGLRELIAKIWHVRLDAELLNAEKQRSRGKERMDVSVQTQKSTLED
jgi:hypothetical protein